MERYMGLTNTRSLLKMERFLPKSGHGQIQNLAAKGIRSHPLWLCDTCSVKRAHCTCTTEGMAAPWGMASWFWMPVNLSSLAYKCTSSREFCTCHELWTHQLMVRGLAGVPDFTPPQSPVGQHCCCSPCPPPNTVAGGKKKKGQEVAVLSPCFHTALEPRQHTPLTPVQSFTLPLNSTPWEGACREGKGCDAHPWMKARAQGRPHSNQRMNSEHTWSSWEDLHWPVSDLLRAHCIGVTAEMPQTTLDPPLRMVFVSHCAVWFSLCSLKWVWKIHESAAAVYFWTCTSKERTVICI